MQAYQFDKKVIGGPESYKLPLWAMLYGLLGGIAFFIFNLIVQNIWILLISLFIGGGIVEAYIFPKARELRIPNRRFIFLSVLLACFVFFLTYHFATYVRFINQVRVELVTTYHVYNLPAAVESANQYLTDKTGSSGWLGFLRLEADNGLSTYYSSRTLRYERSWTGAAAWLFWFIEVVCFLPLGIIGIRMREDPPYCSRCKAWYQTEMVGYVPRGVAELFARLVYSGYCEDAAQFVSRREVEAGMLNLYLGTCRCENGDELVSFSLYVPGPKGSAHYYEYLRGLLPSAKAELLRPKAGATAEPQVIGTSIAVEAS